ncbi:hypothetical protein [Bradyrhizobium lablabi]|uniref:hypothetical protein n=1 Tax=Bradyrhizobium lablabi TaxID=722472 RepID=UPI001BAB4729|nr:hypothetical protein [Bradyrhizobium lablabi]MBR0695624.1 hypothetical protein [Bradyrhizobium lablabi]
MLDLYRMLFLRINVAIIHLVCSLSGASVPMTGLITVALVAAINFLLRRFTRSTSKRLVK